MRRFAFLLGLAVGYVLGTRAGRERYEQLAKAARGVAQHPAVQQAARSAKETGRAAAGRAGSRVGGRLPSAVADRLPGRSRSDEEWGSTGWLDDTES